MITLPPPSRFALGLQAFTWCFLRLFHRFERYGIRQVFNPVLREPIAALVQKIMSWGRRNEGFGLAEERALPGEEASCDSIIETFATYMRRAYRPGEYERGGNTKTHGVLRAEFIVRDDVPERMRHGVFAKPHTYQAWVRFSGPGPDMPNDIDDVGFVSCAIKLMGVPGRKLMDDEKGTQDFISVCTPTFVTPDINANAMLQVHVLRGTPVFYFFTTGFSHFLDFIMQGLWNETQTSPLEARYWSCTPYLLGKGQAMMYSVRPKSDRHSWIPGLPFWTSPTYLREQMARTLSEHDVELDFMVQVQTDAHLMPIEDAGVRWPERLSPFVPVATLRIPRQKFDTPEQFAFARNLVYTPWHCIPEHRPLGNQNRARKRMYWELRKLRQTMNDVRHIEPAGHQLPEGLDTASVAARYDAVEAVS
jgi:hypothetical protein